MTDLGELSPSVYENENENDDEQKDHHAETPIFVTDIVDRGAIMHEIQNSRERGYLFWQFLTEWLIKEDCSSLNPMPSPCKCGKDHEYYPAAWLKAVRKNRWIRDGDPRRPANAEHLGKLLREKKWDLAVLNENPRIVQLLEAINVRPADLRIATIIENPEERDKIVDFATELYAEGIDTERVREIAQKEKKTQRTWEQNQRVGKAVEDLVRKSLEDEGFSVTRVHTGADFEIEMQTMIDTGTLTTLNIDKENQRWLVEVKSTRNESDSAAVRMSIVQAKTAREKKERFLLCVVPIGQENTALDLENVKEKMLFIENIGKRIDQLCGNLEMLEGIRNLITAENPEIELVVEEGNAGVLVKKTFWDADGFPLENLLSVLNNF